MATGTIEYYALSTGLDLGEIEISNAHPKIINIAIKSENFDRISMVFTLSDVYSSEEAGSIANELVNSLLDRLAIEFDISIEEPRCSGMSFPTDESGKKYIVKSNFLAVLDGVEMDIRPGQHRIQELKQKLEGVKPTRNLHLSLYRFSIKQKDPLARFMLLYNILLFLNGEKQKKVDAFIISCDPEVLKTLSPKSPNTFETIYTRLRNEIAHSRNDVIPEHTIKEIAVNVATFQMIVKTAILGNI